MGWANIPCVNQYYHTELTSINAALQSIEKNSINNGSIQIEHSIAIIEHINSILNSHTHFQQISIE